MSGEKVKKKLQEDDRHTNKEPKRKNQALCYAMHISIVLNSVTTGNPTFDAYYDIQVLPED